MPGNSDNKIKFESILWPDTSLERIDAGYEELLAGSEKRTGAGT